MTRTKKGKGKRGRKHHSNNGTDHRRLRRTAQAPVVSSHEPTPPVTDGPTSLIITTPDHDPASSSQPTLNPKTPLTFTLPPLPSETPTSSPKFIETYLQQQSSNSTNDTTTNSQDFVSACRTAILAAGNIQDQIQTLSHFSPIIYLSSIQNILTNNLTITPTTKSRILSALWITNHHPEFDQLVFKTPKFFGVAELFKLVSILDKPRTIRALRSRFTKLQKISSTVPRPCKFENILKQLTNQQTSLTQDSHPSLNLTSSLSKRFKKWLKTSPSVNAHALEFQAAQFPREYWRAVADVLHLKPSDFQLDWFLGYAFEGVAPDCTLPQILSSLTSQPTYSYTVAPGEDLLQVLAKQREENRKNKTKMLYEILSNHPFLARDCYTLIRQWVSHGHVELDASCRIVLAEKMHLEDLIWFFEELFIGSPKKGHLLSSECQGAKEILLGRLKTGEESLGGVRLKRDADGDGEMEGKMEGVESGFRAIAEEQTIDYDGGDDGGSKGGNDGGGGGGGSRRVLNYPKLMERILLLRSKMLTEFSKALLPYASKMLENIHFPGVPEPNNSTTTTTITKPDGSPSLPSPPLNDTLRVSVLGDCSSSMNVAIRTSTIIASILTLKLGATLTFFNGKLILPTLQPTNTLEVIKIAEEIKAQGCTSPAAGLWDLYEKKEVKDLVIVVTDEEENTNVGEGREYNFARLFEKYRMEVNGGVQLFFVSFLDVRDEGQMCKNLVESGVLERKPRQFRLDGKRPDLGKFEELVGILGLEILEKRKRLGGVVEQEGEVGDVRKQLEGLEVSDGTTPKLAGDDPVTKSDDQPKVVDDVQDGWVTVESDAWS
jgi:hypothetical protein